MGDRILTIAIPTFDRREHLERLLWQIERELASLEGSVHLHVQDNCSTDGTSSALAWFSQGRRNFTFASNPSNLGPDENFARCVDAAQGRYLWIFSDDDSFTVGLIPQVLELLKLHSPKALYIRPQPWSGEVVPPSSGLTVWALNSKAFAREVHMMTPFISSWIVDASVAKAANTRLLAGTNLIQLEWVAAAMMAPGVKLYVATRAILYREGNSGGYSYLTVWGDYFPQAVRVAFGTSDEGRRLGNPSLRAMAIATLPQLIYRQRQGKDPEFAIDLEWRPKDRGKLQRIWNRTVYSSLLGGSQSRATIAYILTRLIWTCVRGLERTMTIAQTKSHTFLGIRERPSRTKPAPGS